MRYGSPDLNASAEVAYVRIWNGPLGDGDTFRYSIGLEKKIAENLWLTISAGEDIGDNKRPNNLSALGGIRFGTADKPQIPTPGSN